MESICQVRRLNKQRNRNDISCKAQFRSNWGVSKKYLLKISFLSILNLYGYGDKWLCMWENNLHELTLNMKHVFSKVQNSLVDKKSLKNCIFRFLDKEIKICIPLLSQWGLTESTWIEFWGEVLKIYVVARDCVLSSLMQGLKQNKTKKNQSPKEEITNWLMRQLCCFIKNKIWLST